MQSTTPRNQPLEVNSNHEDALNKTFYQNAWSWLFNAKASADRNQVFC